MCYEHVATPQEKCKHDVEQTFTKNRNGIKRCVEGGGREEKVDGKRK